MEGWNSVRRRMLPKMNQTAVSPSHVVSSTETSPLLKASSAPGAIPDRRSVLCRSPAFADDFQEARVSGLIMGFSTKLYGLSFELLGKPFIRRNEDLPSRQDLICCSLASPTMLPAATACRSLSIVFCRECQTRGSSTSSCLSIRIELHGNYDLSRGHGDEHFLSIAFDWLAGSLPPLSYP